MDLLSNHDNGKAITLKDIAERCSVNVGTVSRALRSDTRLCPTTIERIRSVAKEMGYDASRHHAARRLAMSRFGHPMLNNLIGLFFHHGTFCSSQYFFKMLQGILRAIRWTDFEFCTSDQAMVMMNQKLPEPYRRGDVDGALIMSHASSSLNAVGFLKEDFNFGARPIIGLVDHIDGCSGVYPDHYGAGRTAITHLLDLGHRNIIHFHGEEKTGTDPHALRLSAFHRAFIELRLDTDKHLFLSPWNYAAPEDSGVKFVEFMSKHPECTAIVAHDDEHAATLHGVITKAGYRVPEDISLMGYDDTESIVDKTCINILTTVRAPLFEIGREAMELMMRILLGQEKNEPFDHVMPVELIVRGSTTKPNPRSKPQ
jgi:DNA-binding LacI/PurR family transcriptional regulator